MSSPVFSEVRVSAPMYQTIRAKPATILAFWLIKLPPARLVSVIRLLSRGTAKASYEEVARWRRLVNVASPRCAGNGCLQRSVAIMLIGALRRRSPVWVSGIRMNPFAGHAWVEVDGQPVQENAELSGFIRTLEVDPHKEGINND